MAVGNFIQKDNKRSQIEEIAQAVNRAFKVKSGGYSCARIRSGFKYHDYRDILDGDTTVEEVVDYYIQIAVRDFNLKVAV